MDKGRVRAQKQRLSHKYAKPTAVLLILTVMAITYLISLAALSPKHYDVEVGTAAKETIHAPRDVVDEVATLALRESARSGVLPIYKIDDGTVESLSNGATGFFAALLNVRSAADSMRNKPNGQQLSASGWARTLTQTQKNELCAMSTPMLTQDELCEMLAAGLSDIQMLRNSVMPRLTTSLKGGIIGDGLENIKAAFYQEMKAITGLSDTFKAMGVNVFNSFVGETFVIDQEKTTLARENAAAAVEDVMIRKGEVIAEQGKTISASQLAVMKSLDLVSDDKDGVGMHVGLLLYMLAIYAIFIAYMLLMRGEIMADLKKMIIIATMMIITVLLFWLCVSLDEHISPALIAVMLIAVLACERTAIAVAMVLALTLGMVSGGTGAALFGFSAFSMSISIMVSGAVTVFALKKTSKRGSIIAAGAMGGAAAALVLLGIYVMTGAALSKILVDIGWTMGCSIISAILVVGSLSIWEKLFDVPTAARLNELLNANHPLMKQLMLEAPGTYQHSAGVAALAEGAAQRVGADPLLAKVGAYYHDVGKLRRPLYFMENQKSGTNIHDTLPPAESAAAIIAHQRDSVTILTKHKLPSAVIRISGEHHGNSLMAYFYHKACESAGETIDQKGYRYNGHLPSTKESAIVMLADSCEAAVRSLGECTREAMGDMVHRIIMGKMREGDNMLAKAPLTMAELNEIERSFIKTLGGIMHERIEYPELEEEE
ncbi:MAG: HDIG domain-containing protein [Clostridia bacterium]